MLPLIHSAYLCMHTNMASRANILLTAVFIDQRVCEVCQFYILQTNQRRYGGTRVRSSTVSRIPAGPSFSNTDPVFCRLHGELKSQQGESLQPHVKDSVSSHAPDEKYIDESTIETEEGEEPTKYEKSTLRHVGESLPFAVFLVAIIELCERFTYYGCQGIFQNYVQRPLDGSLGPGALGMGHQGGT